MEHKFIRGIKLLYCLLGEYLSLVEQIFIEHLLNTRYNVINWRHESKGYGMYL